MTYIIHCDKCKILSFIKDYKFNTELNFVCSICGHCDTYYYINCFYYSVFLSKNTLKYYNLSPESLELDKKKEYFNNKSKYINIQKKKLNDSYFNLKNDNFNIKKYYNTTINYINQYLLFDL